MKTEVCGDSGGSIFVHRVSLVLSRSHMKTHKSPRFPVLPRSCFCRMVALILVQGCGSRISGVNPAMRAHLTTTCMRDSWVAKVPMRGISAGISNTRQYGAANLLVARRTQVQRLVPQI